MPEWHSTQNCPPAVSLPREVFYTCIFYTCAKGVRWASCVTPLLLNNTKGSTGEVKKELILELLGKLFYTSLTKWCKRVNWSRKEVNLRANWASCFTAVLLNNIREWTGDLGVNLASCFTPVLLNYARESTGEVKKGIDLGINWQVVFHWASVINDTRESTGQLKWS